MNPNVYTDVQCRDEGSIPFTRSKPLTYSDLLRIGERYCSRFVTVAGADFLIRFWERVSITDPGKCWAWTGTIRRIPGNNYGCFVVGKKNMLAHRLAYELTHGPIPGGLVVCHECDNPPCCNPNHLFAGTKKQNMEDCKRKGRNAHGENHSKSKLTDGLVMEIRRRYASGVGSVILAREFGVGSITVRRIVSGQSWSHLPLIPRLPTPLK